MIEIINDLCHVLSAESVTLDDVIAVSGHSPAASGLRSTTIQPTDPAFSRIVVKTKSDVPSSVKITLAEARPLASLRQALGDYRGLPRVHPEDPASVAFEVDTGGAFTCTVFAEFDPLAEAGDQTPVDALLIRRDRRL